MARLPTDSSEFKRFHLAITRERPDYAPHYLKVAAGDTVKRNGKGEPVDKKDNPVSEDSPNRVNLGKKAIEKKHARITEVQAVKLLERGLNVGIEAETGDNWVIMDVDNPEVVKLSDVKPTLTTRSRKRAGYHYFYIASNPEDTRLKNLRITGVGEIRSGNQYVLAPGSWVDTFDIPGVVPEAEADNAGKYTLESDAPIAHITFDELPKAFRDAIEAAQATNTEADKIATERHVRQAARKAAHPESMEGEGSALFDLQLSDVITIPKGNPGMRFKNPLHPGGTGTSAGISDRGYLQCFSHSVTHTALSCLAVLSGVADCESAGQGFGNSTVGASTVDYTDGSTLWKMWSYAIKAGILPKDDPVMWDAIVWYAINQDVCDDTDLIDGYRLPPGAVSQTKAIIKNKEGIEILNIGTKKPKAKTAAQPETTDVSPNLFLVGDVGKKKVFDANRFAKWLINGSGFTFVTLPDTEEVLLYDDGTYTDGGIVAIRKIVEQIMDGFKVTKNAVNEVIGHIQRRTYAEREEFNKDKRIINLKNGLYDTRTGELKPHTHTYLSTVQIPVTYDPAAVCPDIDKFLSEVLDADDVKAVMEWFGYMMEPEYWIQSILMLLGEGANGKSTLLKLLSAFLGKPNTSNESIHSLTNNRFRVANLYGKLANIYADISDKELKETGILKLLSGGDRISAEKKNKPPFEFENYARMIFSANRLPRARDDTDAWYRRWTFINFTRKFGDDPEAVKKADKKLIHRLTTDSELSGLLNGALKALDGLHERGGFSQNLSTEETRRIYTRLSDPVSVFLEDRCLIDPKMTVAKSTLFNAYVEYCKVNRQAPIGQAAFTKRIRDMGKFTDCQIGSKGQQERGWRGLNIDGSIFDSCGNTLGNTLGD